MIILLCCLWYVCLLELKLGRRLTFVKALFTFYCAFVLDGVHYGTGRHLKDIMKEPHGDRNFVIGMKVWMIKVGAKPETNRK